MKKGRKEGRKEYFYQIIRLGCRIPISNVPIYIPNYSDIFLISNWYRLSAEDRQTFIANI